MSRIDLARAYSDRAREAQQAGDYRSAAALFGEAIALLSLPFNSEVELPSGRDGASYGGTSTEANRHR